MSLKIYELAPDRFSLYQHQQWQAALRKAKVKLGLSSVTDMVLMIEKEEEYVMLFLDMEKVMTNT